MKKTKSYPQYQAAFTIVELLVVIVVIGILAAIGLVAYTGIQNRAVTASLISDLDNASKLVSIDQVVNGTYPATQALVNNGKGIPASSGTAYDYFPTPTSFCLTATKDSSSYRITNSSPARLGVCSGSERDKLSIIKWASWAVGVGSVAGYGLNGDGNSRIIDTNPWGTSDVIWDVSNQDAASDADGGWGGGSFVIDNTKMYRFSTFIKRKTIGNGSTYLGMYGYPVTVLNRSNGALNSNPYFNSLSWWGGSDQWYLMTGFVWPAGSGAGAAMEDSGIYDLSGTKIRSNADFVWQSTTTSASSRSYLFNSTDTATNQQWYQPRVDVVDGTEPTINELLNNTF